ncbi:fumarylacetoacetate hydrolase family protein [Monashia sp. NPDC004114]
MVVSEAARPVGADRLRVEQPGRCSARSLLRLLPALDRDEDAPYAVQDDTTGDLLFDPVALVKYLSTMITLRPGDLIATGTPGGVGHARKPARYLEAGQTVVTEIEGLGRCENAVVADRLA